LEEKMYEPVIKLDLEVDQTSEKKEDVS